MLIFVVVIVSATRAVVRFFSSKFFNAYLNFLVIPLMLKSFEIDDHPSFDKKVFLSLAVYIKSNFFHHLKMPNQKQP